MRSIRIGVLAAVIAVCGVSAAAQDAQGHDHAHERDLSGPPKAMPPVAPASAEAPATPAGSQLKWLLLALEGRDDVKASDRVSPGFLEKVPADKLDKVLNDLRTGSGGFVLRSVEERDAAGLVAACEARADRSMWKIVIEVEAEAPHRMTTLFFQPAPEAAVPALSSLDDAAKAIAEQGEKRALAVYRVAWGEGGAATLTPMLAVNEREPLALGSAFKVFVLGALERAVSSGKLSWQAPVEIRDEWKSLPTGVMQRLPRGTEKPLSEYALNMMAISDNTATDHIMGVLGRGEVERYYLERVKRPGRTMPFLTTREAFSIKVSMDGELLGVYADADEAGRRELLAGRVAETPPNEMVAQQWRIPQRVDAVEWFASAEEMCRALAEALAAAKKPGNEPMLAALTKNPGVPVSASAWRTVAFKGGSEPGVLCLTWVLERASGEGAFAVCIAVNDTRQPLDEQRLVGLGQRVLEWLEKAPSAPPAP